MDRYAIHLMRLSRARTLFRKGDDFLLNLAITDTLERLGAVQRQFENAAALFGRTPSLTEKVRQLQSVNNVTRIEERLHFGETDSIATPDMLNLEPDSFDLVVAPLALHWAEDLPGTLIQIARALKPDGLLLASLPGPDTLMELRQSLLQAESETTNGAALRIDPFTDIRDAGALLQRCGFALPVVDQETVTVRYDTMFDLVSDLRRFGGTSRTSNAPLSRKTAIRAAQIYADQFSDPDGRLRASFSIVSLSGWRPHDNQQQPLKPGSAKTRLADALKTQELPLKP